MRQLQASLGADEEGRRSVVDPTFRKAWLDQSLKTMMEIYVRCLVKELADRPSIEYVLWNLQFASQMEGNEIVAEGPRCSLHSRKVYSALSVDYLKMFLLNVPATVVAL
ncbi:hypothetical protein JHK87_018237 [Glycine soja]|nr:hypothetical protein JHK87_018237 [Glycine soja]